MDIKVKKKWSRSIDKAFHIYNGFDRKLMKM